MTIGSQQQAAQQAHGNGEAKKEDEWHYPKHRDWAREGQFVEFYSIFGVRHLGIAISINVKEPVPGHLGGGVRNRIVLMSEDSSIPEYFVMEAVEKWRETEDRVMKKRFIGQTVGNTFEHAGVVTPIFISYLGLRMAEKLKELEGRNELQTNNTMHYINEFGQHQWETDIGFFSSTHVVVKIIELEDESGVKVNFSDTAPLATRSRTGERFYHFKDVARASEDICRYFLGEESL